MSSKRMSVVFAALAAVSLSACASSAPDETPSMASAVKFDDGWARAAESGMTAVFGTFVNTGDREAHIVGGESPAAARVEIHEVAPDAGGTMAMRPKEGGITVAPEGTQELVPGGDHLMLMDLTGPLQPGSDVALTVTFEDGSTLPIAAQVRDFAGGDEEYAPSAHGHG
ncbi:MULTISPECIES: copper chaperone PCu(A)C [Mycolicibacterium]|uniref:copper chaperone PCu(A)C n=1 Tax=Mycolicibacterium TaxID=1866885 RepID=UPI001F179A4C|nr:MULTISPECIES: copper chaperone PCu(A)C [Mycolicibacterium]MDW5614758.1 copper chaperone PCu(A)C [Mycolicibacterium sp. D5.8-2]UJL26720.1 copper chaperone PCu(A)C [Mycolicibacterium vanbaalenii]WND58832.1 copper chaperone PCu(A)C [Mycolicibacterium vanbaalenii]